MVATELLEKIGESLGSTATVKTLFGEPVHAEGKTVIPVAKVAYGFGAGGGSAPQKDGAPKGEGGGGGGGVRAFPAGALEITSGETRFIGFPNYRLMAAVFGMGMLAGWMLLGWRRR